MERAGIVAGQLKGDRRGSDVIRMGDVTLEGDAMGSVCVRELP